MNGKKSHSADDSLQERSACGRAEPQKMPQPRDIEIVDLGRASERTCGSYSGFIVEQSPFPLYAP